MNYYSRSGEHSVYRADYVYSDGLTMPDCHVHGEFELLFIVEGEALLENSTEVTRLRAPAVVMHAPYTLHRANVSGDYRRYIIYYDLDTNARVSACGTPYSELSNMTVCRLDRAFADTLEFYFRRMFDKENDELCRELLFSLVFRELSAYRTPENTEEHSPSRAYVSEIRAYIAENFAAPLTLDGIADRFFISRAKLVSDFRRSTGATVKNYITVVRISNARNYLRSGMSAADTAAACGYNSESNFGFAFKKLTGMSPGEYAKRTYAPRDGDSSLFTVRSTNMFGVGARQ